MNCFALFPLEYEKNILYVGVMDDSYRSRSVTSMAGENKESFF